MCRTACESSSWESASWRIWRDSVGTNALRSLAICSSTLLRIGIDSEPLSWQRMPVYQGCQYLWRAMQWHQTYHHLYVYLEVFNMIELHDLHFFFSAQEELWCSMLFQMTTVRNNNDNNNNNLTKLSWFYEHYWRTHGNDSFRLSL